MRGKPFLYLVIFSVLFAVCFCVACKKTITRDRAIQTITSLPELKSISEQISSVDQNVKLSIRDDSTAGENDQRWEFYIGEEHPERTVFLMRIAIDKKSGDIYIFDTDLAEYVPLEEWRSKSK